MKKLTILALCCLFLASSDIRANGYGVRMQVVAVPVNPCPVNYGIRTFAAIPMYLSPFSVSGLNFQIGNGIAPLGNSAFAANFGAGDLTLNQAGGMIGFSRGFSSSANFSSSFGSSGNFGVGFNRGFSGGFGFNRGFNSGFNRGFEFNRFGVRRFR